MSTPTNNCCDACKCHKILERDKVCHDSKCPCHADKGECQHTKIVTSVSFKGRRRICNNCGVDIPKSAPTQPESSWEERFDKTFPQTVSMAYETVDIGALKEFIAQEVSAAEERGIDIGGKTKGGTGRFMYQQGRRDVLESCGCKRCTDVLALDNDR